MSEPRRNIKLKQMRVLVCGGRYFNDKNLLIQTLDGLADEFELWASPDKHGNSLPLGLLIISGGASGADQLAAGYAAVNWTGYKEFPANWAKYGRAAGPIRNQQMLDEGKPDLVIAFPGGRGNRPYGKSGHESRNSCTRDKCFLPRKTLS